MAEISGAEKHRIKRLIKELKSYRAMHTEFVTVYIPSGYNLDKINQHLSEELGTASNIKSTSTRKNVQAALEKMLQHLKGYKKTPENGLAIFSGNIASGEGRQDMRIISFEPPVPLKMRIYRCDKSFVTEVLENMLVIHDVYGIVVLDRRDANIAILRGKTIVPLQKTHSEVPGKFRAGGQCLAFDTSVMIADEDEVTLENVKVGDMVMSYNFDTNDLEESEVIDKWDVRKTELYDITTDEGTIQASGDHIFFVDKGTIEEVATEDLEEGNLLITYDGRKVEIEDIKREAGGNFLLIDISVANKNFIANNIVVHNSAQRFARIREGAYKDHFKKIAEYMKEQFLPLGNNLKGIIIGGPGTTVNNFLNKDYVTGDVKKKIIGTKDLSYTGETGMQELLDKSGDLLAAEEVAQEKKIMLEFFSQFQKDPHKVTYGEKETVKALEMNAVNIILISENIPEEKFDQLEEMAEKGGSKIKVISTETREGIQLQNLGGIAAILRFPL
jgi:peptide subunit release factor 1 (eRF1)